MVIVASSVEWMIRSQQSIVKQLMPWMAQDQDMMKFTAAYVEYTYRVYLEQERRIYTNLNNRYNKLIGGETCTLELDR